MPRPSGSSPRPKSRAAQWPRVRIAQPPVEVEGAGFWMTRQGQQRYSNQLACSHMTLVSWRKMKSVSVIQAPWRTVCRGVGYPGAGGVSMPPLTLTDMMRTSASVAAKVPELWAKVGGGRSRVAGSGRQMGSSASSESAGAGAPSAGAGGAGAPPAGAEGAVVDGVEEAPVSWDAERRRPGACWPEVAVPPSGRPPGEGGVVTEGPTPVAEAVLMARGGSGAPARRKRALQEPPSRRRGAEA